MIPSAAHWARQPHENQQQQDRSTNNTVVGLLGSPAGSWQVPSSDHIQQQQGDWAGADQSPYNLQHHIEAAIKAQQQQQPAAAWGGQSGISVGWDNPMILANTAQSHQHHNGTQEHHYHPGLQQHWQEGGQQEAAANNIALQSEPLTAAASSQLSRHYEALLVANNPALISSLPSASSSTIWPAALLSSTHGGLRSGDHEGQLAGNSGGSYSGFHSINGLIIGAAGGLHGNGSSSTSTGEGGSLNLYDASGPGSSDVTNNTTASRLYDAASSGHGSSANTASTTSTTSSEQDAAARLVNLLGLGASLEEQRSRLQGLMGTSLSSSTDLHHHHHHHQQQQQHHQLSELSTRIGLNLGGRTYFSASDELQLQADQDHHAHGGFMMLGGYGRFSGAAGKRSFSMIRHGVPGLVHAPAPSCQADGCKADLALAKPYHRRHKVCDSHSKATSVSIAGQTQRFCQQCSRFHGLPEFDDVKRSCRKRLADHNRRRRKSQPPPSTSDVNPSTSTAPAAAAAAAASVGLTAPITNDTITPAVTDHDRDHDHAKVISGPDDDEDDHKSATITDLQGGRPYQDEKDQEQWSNMSSTLPLASTAACVDQPQVDDHPMLRHVEPPQPQDAGHLAGPGPRLSLTSTQDAPRPAGTRGASWTPDWLRRGSSTQEDGSIMDVASRSPPRTSTKDGANTQDKSLGLGTTYTSSNGMKSFGLQELGFSQNKSTCLDPWEQHDIIG